MCVQCIFTDLLWVAFNSFPDLTDALLTLSCALCDTPEEPMHSVDRFIILTCDRTSTATEVNKARKKLFCEEECSRTNPTNNGGFGTARETSSFVVMSRGKTRVPKARAGLFPWTGAGWKLMESMNHTGQNCQKHPSSVMNLPLPDAKVGVYKALQVQTDWTSRVFLRGKLCTLISHNDPR